LLPLEAEFPIYDSKLLLPLEALKFHLIDSECLRGMAVLAAFPNSVSSGSG
jgi:hypothetical protein